MSPRGGARPGSGGPRLYPEERLTQCNGIMLRKSDIEFLTKYGNGSRSAGIRRLVDAQHREGEKE